MIPRRRLVIAFLLTIAIAGAFSFRLGHAELHADEITYMNAVFESMLQERAFPVQGDGSLFLNKPPGALWLMRLSFEILGPSPFAARLPSVLVAAATAGLLFLFGAALWGEGAGLLAALVFAFTPSPLVRHGLRAATPDALEILLVTIAIGCIELWRRQRARWALATMVTAVAATAWVKSPFAALVFICYLAVTEWPARRAGRGTPRLVLTLGLVVGAWAAAFSLWLAVLAADTSPRAVTRRLIYQQYGRRIEGRLGRSHLAGPDFYPRSLASDFGPLLLLPLGAGMATVLRRRRGEDGGPIESADVASLAAWSLAAPLLASASASKLTWYAYLSHPGLALSIAAGAAALPAIRGHRWPWSLAAAGLLAVRLPLADAWPETPRHRGPAGQLWEMVQHDPSIEVDAGAGLRLPRQPEAAYREARFYLRTLLERPPVADSSCRALLVNDRAGHPAPHGRIEIFRPSDEERVGLWLIDECGGRLVAGLP